MVLANGLFHDVDMDGINYGRAKEIVSKSRKELLQALALIDEKEKEKSKKIPMGAGNVLWEEASTKGEPNG